MLSTLRAFRFRGKGLVLDERKEYKHKRLILLEIINEAS